VADGDFRITFAIERRLPGEDDFTEVGFGTSGTSSTIDHAAHLLNSALQNREWETEEGMPDPEEVDGE
jgi:hypothetical protein